MEALIGGQAVDQLDFEALETALRERALGVAARAVENCFNADASDRAGAALPCPCGGTARYAGRRGKDFKTLLGEVRLQRAYYHCADCGAGFCPRDQALGMQAGSLSPAVTRMVGAVGSMVSFAEGSQLLWELAGARVDAKQVERAAEALGEEAARDEREHAEPPDQAEPIPSTLYLGMDGTGLPMRGSELEGRAGKQPDGSAKTREIKLCSVWSAESRDAQGRPVRDPGSATYTAAVESARARDTDRQASPFAGRVEREARRRGFDRAERQVVLGDGARWIWQIADELFPEAVQIVDRFHVKERLHEAAKEIHPGDAPLAHQWAQARCAELDSGDVGAILRSLAPHLETCEAAAQCQGYLRQNRHRMRYAEFHAQGLCTSSGVVEAACKNVIGARLKRSGMHWTVRGANAIAALRCCRLSGRVEDFWERRASPRTANLSSSATF